MKRKSWVVVVAVLILVLSTVGITGAITDGDLDGDGHPYVVLLRVDLNPDLPPYWDGWRCSATLLSPTVVLTAGHCTSNAPDPEEAITGMRIFTESDVENGDNTYPTCDGGNCIEAVYWESHPGYAEGPWFAHDVGIVILADPVYLDEYGVLPEAGVLDQLKTRRGHKKDLSWFTAVGYGLQESFPDPAYWKTNNVKTRMVSYPELIQINTPGFTGDFSLLLSNNPSTGGTCFGDSGGPNFWTDSNIVAGVTSFGMNGNCAGTGGVFRMDRQNVLDFVNQFLP
jgi:hypothetical protein